MHQLSAKEAAEYDQWMGTLKLCIDWLKTLYYQILSKQGWLRWVILPAKR